MAEFDTPINYFQYNNLFGIRQTNYYTVSGKQKEALDRAWSTRSYEIDKFWQRSKFFWSFIGLVFGAFGAVKTKNFHLDGFLLYIDLYLILLGGIVSVAWLLVIKASKRWQENWEHHIDWLEDEITGPLYKTVYCSQKQFYSVSRVNEILAWVAIVIWILLFINFFANCNFVQEILKLLQPYGKQILGIIIPILLTFICICIMLIKGRSSGISKPDKNKYPNGAFFKKEKII